MGDWPRLVNLRRCARGHIFDNGESTNTTVALTNDSTGAELILVWQMLFDNDSDGTPQLSYQQIKPMSTVGNVTPLVPGDAPPPGTLTGGDQATHYVVDGRAQSAQAFYWPATFPFAVLLPGWSLAVQNDTGNLTGKLGMFFFWEAILPKYFDRMHTHYYLELALAQQGG
jgi:hypothetical protein